jgi:uncharacterized protein YbaP (TraB family)
VDGPHHGRRTQRCLDAKLRHYRDEGQAVILVGAMHLPGPHGLISRLRSAGYTVTTIMLPAKTGAG